MSKESGKGPGISRRDFVRAAALAAAAGAARADGALWRAENAAAAVSAVAGCWRLPLERGWLFGKSLPSADESQPQSNAANFSQVTLPHCVAALGWQNWNPDRWQDVWIYRRHFHLPAQLSGRRIFLRFSGVMTAATPQVNGRTLPRHVGGYLPFEYEITGAVRQGRNILSVAVDSRWANTPPEGSRLGPKSIDYLEPGGMVRAVSLLAAPATFIRDVFAKPVRVLDADRRVEVTCTLDAAISPAQPLRLEAELLDGSHVLARDSQTVRVSAAGRQQAALTLSSLGNVKLWHVDSPRLYSVAVTLWTGSQRVDSARARIGLREARFEVDGFFLNGGRLQIFGLNRHELYPYAGFAMPPRVLRDDALILRRQFNCNFVRCSHYPQSEAFLDACDELGLMVWEELPGWQYLGNAEWRERAVRDVADMVRRDRNHPAIVIWGVRINESANDPALYRRTRQTAKSLDDSRLTSGTMTRHSTRDWLQDVFAFDDYHKAAQGGVGIQPPVEGVPYLVTEAVGQFDYNSGAGFGVKYRRAADAALQAQQALRHAQAHSRGAAQPRCAGVIAWCAFDYASLMNSYHGVKCPGVADSFRIPKLGAAFYTAQKQPEVQAVIEPSFYWDFGPETPAGPGEKAAIFSNCDRLEVFIDGRLRAKAEPDRESFPHLKHPPFFVNLTANAAALPELRIDGYTGGRLAISRSFSSDRARDQLLLRADHARLRADGCDATRVMFQAADRYCAPRAFSGGAVTLAVSGPGFIVGENPFNLGENGGAGAVWIRTIDEKPGRIRLTAAHPVLGKKAVEIQALPARAEEWAPA